MLEGTEEPRPARVARYSRRGGAPSLSISERARARSSEISSMNLIRAARVSSLNLANQIYIGDARRFRGRAVAARLHRIKYCVGRCSRSLILSQFFSGCGGGCGAYIVLMVYVVRALYTPVGSPTGFCMGYQPSQRRCVSGALLEERPRRDFPPPLSLVVAPSGHLLIIRW